MINGMINIYKERGFTSHDVVAKLRGILHQKKIGHTGTLDPEAEGVLPVCLGHGTKLCQLLTDKDKTYEAVLLLGVVTDTEDTTGTVIKESKVKVSKEEAEAAILSFVGEYDQIPPMYSAVKIGGKKLYELAREGKVVERKARRVRIIALRIKEWNLSQNRITLEVTCSKGTYIRTLCQDIGEKLGCGGCMDSLIRTRVDRFTIEESLTLLEAEQSHAAGEIAKHVVSVESMFPEYTKITVNEAGENYLFNGNPLRIEQTQQAPLITEKERVLMYDKAGTFRAIYEWQDEKKCFLPVKMFL